MCREYARFTPIDGELSGTVGAGVVVDPKQRRQIELDAVVFAPEEPGHPKRILSLGEAKWGEVMGLRQAARLARARELLAENGYNVDGCRLVCYSTKGFEEALLDDATVTAVSPADLYAPPVG